MIRALKWYENFLFLFFVAQMKNEPGASVKDLHFQSVLHAAAFTFVAYIVFVTTFVARVFGIILHPAEDPKWHGLYVFVPLVFLHWVGFRLIGQEAMQVRMDSATETDLKSARWLLNTLYVLMVTSGFLIVFLW